jgi:hypothetical protein
MRQRCEERRIRSRPTTSTKRPNHGAIMNVTLSLGPVVSLIAGILILIMPRLLNYIVALYLIIIGLIEMFGYGRMHF